MSRSACAKAPRSRARRAREHGAGLASWLLIDGMGRRILIVEDDDLLRAQLSRLFTGRGYEVETAASISAFVTAVAGSRFDACLFDLSLPDGDGLAFVRLSRAVSTTADVPIIVLTSHYDANARAEVLAQGPARFPVVVDALCLSATPDPCDDGVAVQGQGGADRKAALRT